MAAGRPLDLEQEILENFDQALRVSEHLVAVLPVHVWRARGLGYRLSGADTMKIWGWKRMD